MTRSWLRGILAFALSSPGIALAAFQVQQLYSNADGSIQFVMLRETAGQNGHDQLAGKTLTATRAERTRTFTFPANLPHAATANRSVLIATQGYLDAPPYATEFRTVAPDYVVPDRFLPTDGGSVDLRGHRSDELRVAAARRLLGGSPDGRRGARQRGAELRRCDGEPAGHTGDRGRVLPQRRSITTS